MMKIEAGDIITFMDENNQEQEIEVLDTLRLEETDYAAVGFTKEMQDESKENINVFFLKLESDEQFSIIEDDEEFNKISAAFAEAETDC